MKTLFKKLDVNGVAVLLLAFFVALGFKAREIRQDDRWYQISITDTDNPEEPENQQIGSQLSSTGPVHPCDEALADTLCAIQLRFLNPEAEVPSTVEEAEEMENDGDLEIIDHSFKLTEDD